MEKTRVPEELLFRWDDEGALRGVHFKECEVWRENGLVEHRRILDPRPVTPEEAHALLGECHGDLLALTTSQAEDITRRDAQLDQAERALAAEMATVSALQDALAAMTAERDALRQRLADLLPQPSG